MNGAVVQGFRVLVIAGVSGALGLAANSLSPRGIPVLSARGPGAWIRKAERISVQELEKARRSERTLVILDVRSPVAYRLAHPAGALGVPAHSFREEYVRQGLDSVLRASDGIVVLCEGDRCDLGDRVSRLLEELGHRPVYVLAGGWEAYQTSGTIVRGIP